MKIAVLIARILLGLIFVVFGLHFFFHFSFMPAPTPMPEKAQAFTGGLYGSGYFLQYMKVIEITSGLAILVNRFTAFFLLILFPITLNIFLFHAILVPSGIPVAAVIIILHLFLAFAYRKYYASLFTAVPTIS
ncbi:DoxX family membrane protein [Mucilaginibacter sp. HC2]|uniref:DoxX family membrane protein n=1 Tax=Mucilaginibacter inviolabilis TaxID=2714892 RepID=UPI00140BC873|nr:DoxX family membrane protein [Mucilaginibacter inviolabilis]NHA08050.1 DoxX family membrane protein [Mucilaginibacter inviolabilis]